MDSIVQTIIDEHIARADKGYTKYGHDLDRDDLTIEDWIEHAKTEAMDFVLYLEKLKQEFKRWKTQLS